MLQGEFLLLQGDPQPLQELLPLDCDSSRLHCEPSVLRSEFPLLHGGPPRLKDEPTLLQGEPLVLYTVLRVSSI